MRSLRTYRAGFACASHGVAAAAASQVSRGRVDGVAATAASPTRRAGPDAVRIHSKSKNKRPTASSLHDGTLTHTFTIFAIACCIKGLQPGNHAP